MKIKLEFPFDIKQTSNNSVTLDVADGHLALVQVANLGKCFPWLNEEQQDLLIEQVHTTLITDAIRLGITSRVLPPQ